MRDPEKLKDIPNVNSISGNDGLPEGAKKFEDKKVAILLQEMWNKEVEFFETTKIGTNGGLDRGNKNVPGLERFEVEISEPESEVFKGKLHPKVEGTSWYRGIAVKADAYDLNNLVLIFSGWMEIDTEGGAPPPIVYTVGYVPDQTVRKVIQAYTMGMSTYFNRLRSSYPK